MHPHLLSVSFSDMYSGSILYLRLMCPALALLRMTYFMTSLMSACQCVHRCAGSPSPVTASSLHDVTDGAAATVMTSSSAANSNASFTTTLQQNKQELEDLFSHALQTPAAATAAADLSTSRSANVSTNELSSASFVTPPARKMQTGNDVTDAYSHITDQAELHNMVRLYHGQWFL